MLRGTETDADNIDVWPTQKTVEWPSQPCMSCPYPCGGGCGPAKRAWLFIHNATNVPTPRRIEDTIAQFTPDLGLISPITSHW